MKNLFQCQRKILNIFFLLIIIYSCEKSSKNNDFNFSPSYEQSVTEVNEISDEYSEQQKLRVIEDSIQRIKDIEEDEFYEKYINNSLSTGDTPYSNCYGKNKKCNEDGCSVITINTPDNSDVLVTIKSGEEVVRHAYISSNSSFKFHVPSGSYQPFFYYGKGWNPEKVMKKTECGLIKGGFITEESIGKDDTQFLSNNELTYTLILQENGNFSTKPSSSEEAF